VGVAESYRGEDGGRSPDATPSVEDGSDDGRTSTLAAVVTRADRTVDGFAFGACSVGGLDATSAVTDLLARLDREDVGYVVVSGIAPAWFNVLDLPAVHDATDRPVLSVSFEGSPGLEPALRQAFDGEVLDERLSIYRRQPPRERLTVNDESVFVRAVGIDADEARDVVRAFTPTGGRPEPLRVARLAARAADRWRADS
jgi:endonuclease V-like protein UPF0215 family